MTKTQKWEAKFHECLALEFSNPSLELKNSKIYKDGVESLYYQKGQ